MEDNKHLKAHVVAVNMGYGHQRAAYPLTELGGGHVINADDYDGSTITERESWTTQTGLYEAISAFKKIPVLGPTVFGAMDYFQDIPSLYPKRSLEKHTAQQLFFYNKVKKGLGQNLIKRLNKSGKPLVATFPVPIYFAEYYKFKYPLYCVVCDADISRFWAPIDPAKSKAIYLVPTATAATRLTLYGVRLKQIIITGFPLPKENIGGITKPILKSDLATRLVKLDPSGSFAKLWPTSDRSELPKADTRKTKKPLHLILAIGGAGAQAELATTIITALNERLVAGDWKLTLIAGVRKDVKTVFETTINQAGAAAANIDILFAANKITYFQQFNQLLRQTDIIITKPSELSFYAALGLPIIMTPPVGAQEIANRNWLISIGAGLDALDWRYADQWLGDWLNTGQLARAAFLGYRQAEALGAYNIETIIQNNS